MRLFFILIGIICMMPVSLHAQDSIRGIVYGTLDGKKEPLPGATVSWVNSKNFAFSKADGSYSIDKELGNRFLYARFVGFNSDTIQVSKGQESINFNLRAADVELDEVVVRDKQQASSLKARDAKVTQLITARELTKAACCNLSESFETNPAIDASFTDAVTGTRQIRLLGLDGPYSYYTRGNIPTMGGVASVLGLQLIPGSWIQSIQLTKGSGSVVNGFESVAGQVNYELRQPDGNEKFYMQLYGNAGGRLEQSVVLPLKINDSWSTSVMLYGREQIGSPDFNEDGFLDMPQGRLLIAQNMWKYRGTKGWETQFGFKYADNDQVGGQLEAPNANPGDSIWRAGMTTKRFEYWQKAGYVFKNSPGRSIGFQWSFNWHDQTADFGLPEMKTYTGLEKNFYFNVIYQDIIKTTDHQYKVGLSYKNQAIDEVYLSNTYLRREQIPGAFIEYSYFYLDNLSVVAGTRLDVHSQYGAFFTPRLHARYVPFKNHTFRFNAGKAYRTANLFADHLGAMASNRQWNIYQGDEAIPYEGILQEESFNTGLSYAYTFEWDFRPGSIRAEYFYTTFQNQLVKDWDAGTQQLNFYNLNGQSFVHNLQVQFDYELIQRLDFRAAYRFVEARTEYNSIGLADQPFIAKHRVFANVGYETVSAWKFDATVNWMSEQRLPSTSTNNFENRRGDASPAFATLNVQIAKTFREKLEVHIGAENVFNYRQPNPIVSAQNPFDTQFDASMIWGPIMGRVLYGGIRLNLF